MVARSNDDGNGDDDNSIVTMFYRGKAEEDTVFQVHAKPASYTHWITPKHFQMGYTTYGPGHAWNQ